MSAKTKKVLFIVLLLGISLGGQARHIIGGVMTYECRGGNVYRFTIKMYRDCNCTMCAEFDPVAAVAVYKCGNLVNCGSLNQSPSDWFTTSDVPLLSVTEIGAPDYPCLIPPDVCVQEGIYVFDLNLPPSSESYHISYQRCCRNVTISNIINPEDAGATFTIELTPEAQQVCNNSPVFDDFPPTVICAGAPLEYDHSATDPDGDQLVYEFCAPLLGGGPMLDAVFYASCSGASPDPACPPPYSSVPFSAPAYTALKPMGGAPPVTIDPNTGIITGTPNIIGQYVVGVCVSEYRAGVLLSRVFRDFQFNVANCDPTVVADVLEDEILGDQEFVINSCGTNAITFVNQSFQENFIDVLEWRFDINGTNQSFTDWSPTVVFPGVGQYEGVLILNPNTDCGDTAKIYVNVFPDIDADFSFAYDTCVAGPVEFTDLSTTGSCCMVGWEWNFGDGESAQIPDPSHLYRIPGDIPVSLTVRDTNQCEDEITKILHYYPVPNLIVIAPSEFIGCVPADIFFDNLSFPIDDTYDIDWDFGDGGSSDSISPTHIYETDGVYTVSVSIISPIGCETDTVFNDLITVLPSPIAGFDYSPDDPSILEPEIRFSDESSGALRWNWDFGDGSAGSVLANPTHTYRDTGMVQVMQVVTHPSGCQDTLIRFLDIKPEVRYFIPNAFTPNGDSTNDLFRGVGIMEGATNFSMTIWNRWGELVFETSDPFAGWNGKKNSVGKDSPSGVYIVLVTFNGPRGEPIQIKNFVTLLR
ncbi:MAG: hypothetical protein DHS20C18_44660 [Saprospiraceae bacterium]|nr:MAG: hypothetical protein DHS20C18_44660 [Saprospiraceae bacterium]